MKKILVVILAIGMIASVGCKRKVPVTGAEKDAVIAAADPITDSILAGYNDGDYAVYAKDFDEMMKNQLTEEVFKQTREMIIGKIGKYESRKVSKVYKKDQYTVVEYTAKFELEEEVNVKVVMQKLEEKWLVSGLWFNSPKLRK